MQCRRCEVHCDKVVYPGACLEKGCPFVYSYEAWGQTYVGCMQKVYDVEIDLDMLRAAERRLGGLRRDPRRPPAAADVPLGDREHLRLAERRDRVHQSRVRRAARRRADVPHLRAAQVAHGPAEQCVLAAPANGARRQPGEPEQKQQRAAERERVDRADPDPVERDAEPVERAGPVCAAGGRRGARRELEVDGRVARRVDRRGAAALQLRDLRRERRDMPGGLVACGLGLPVGEPGLEPRDLAGGRVDLAW